MDEFTFRSVRLEDITKELEEQEVLEFPFFRNGHLFVQTDKETIRIIPSDSTLANYHETNPEYLKHEAVTLPSGKEILQAIDNGGE